MKRVLKFLKHNGFFILSGAVVVASIVSIPFIFMSGLTSVAATFVSIGVFFASLSASLLIATIQNVINYIVETKKEGSQDKYTLKEENLTLEDKEQLAAIRLMQEKRLAKIEKRKNKKRELNGEKENDLTL